MARPSRLLLVLSVGLSCGPPPRVAADSAAPRAAPATPAPSPLALEPLLDGELAEGGALWSRGDAAGARRALLAATTGAEDTERVRAARLVAAMAALDANDPASARTELEAMAASWPLMAPLALAHAAQAALQTGAAADAEALAARVPEDCPWGALARQVLADAAYARRDFAAAEERYARIVEDRSAPRRLAARRRLGESIAAQIRPGHRDPGRAARAIVELRTVALAVPGTRLGQSLETRIATLSRQLPAAERARLSLTPAQTLVRAESLLAAQKNGEAERSLKALVRELPESSTLRCRARLRLGESVMRQRDRSRAAPLLEDAVRACRGRDDEARALYLSGKVHAAIGRHEDAIGRFGEIEARHTDSTLTDDARLLAAQSALALGRVDVFRDRLRTLPEAYPSGDMVGEALWQLAWQEWGAGDLSAALETLDALEVRVPHEDGFWSAGRAPYWRGRVLARLGRTDDAVASWRKTVREYPLSYYMLLALARLDAIEPKSARALWDELSIDRTPAPGLPAEPTTEVLVSEGFARARLLLRAGLGELATRELAVLGIDGANGSGDGKWLAAYLLDRAGDPARAHDILRRQLPEFARQWPTGGARRKWLVAYPRPFADLVGPVAQERSLPEPLVYAIVREESGFRPGIESWANAVGLTQLMPATARRFGAPLGLTANAQTLRDPGTNLRIGAAFLAFLAERFAASPLLIPAGYNAGESALKRWVDARGQADLDEVVENIPYDETRGYTKRVAASWGTYHALYGDGSPPLVALRLP